MQQMQQLREHYVKGLGAQIDALLLARHALNEANPEAMASLRRLAHRLHGSGTTYGFPAISEAAGRVEHASNEDLAGQVDALIAVLRSVSVHKDSDETTILLVEDNPSDLATLQVALARPGRRLLSASSLREAEPLLQSEPLSMVLMDLVLPDGDARNLMLRLREHPQTANTPVCIISARLSDTVKAECYALGAEQFFDKPIHPEMLAAAVSATLHRCLTASENARTDPLTGLPNRASILESFERLAACMRRNRQPFSVGILDLDHFKSINDRYGHGTGDDVLCWVADCIRRSLRQSDVLGRWGGEEFVVLLPDAGAAGARTALDKALCQLRRAPFAGPGGVDIELSFSAGVAQVGPEDGIEQAMAGADRLLYLAKQAGRARVFEPASQVDFPQRTVLLAEDDPTLALLVVKTLGNGGLHTIHSSNGQQALEHVEQSRVDLAILDVEMPGMNGFELLQRLRDKPQLAEVPVVMLTGRGSEADVVRGFEGGADDYIVKPFVPAELLARVHRLLKKRSVSR